MSAVAEIDFGDPRGLTDLSTFIGRARVAVPEGAIRLQVPGRGLLVVTVAVLEGSGLMGDGTVLGLRAVRIRDATPGIDATVTFASVTDRPGATPWHRDDVERAPDHGVAALGWVDASA